VPKRIQEKMRRGVYLKHSVQAVGAKTLNSSSLRLVVAEASKDVEMWFNFDSVDGLRKENVGWKSSFYIAGEFGAPRVESVHEYTQEYHVSTVGKGWVFPGSVIFLWDRQSMMEKRVKIREDRKRSIAEGKQVEKKLRVAEEDTERQRQ
jgi:hypothetical protein